MRGGRRACHGSASSRTRGGPRSEDGTIRITFQGRGSEDGRSVRFSSEQFPEEDRQRPMRAVHQFASRQTPLSTSLRIGHTAVTRVSASVSSLSQSETSDLSEYGRQGSQKPEQHVDPEGYSQIL